MALTVGKPGCALLLAVVWSIEALALQQTFRAVVDAVLVDVSVMQAKRPVVGLTARDFTISDNGIAQQAIDAVRGTIPLDISLLVDVSAGMNGSPGTMPYAAKHLPAEAWVREGVGNVIASLTPADRIQVISFATAIREMRADAATSVIGRLGGGLVAGRTALQDAVMLSLMQPTPPDRRRAIVVLTDGVDSSSVTEYGIRRQILDRSDTVVYVIACGSRDFRTRPQEGSPNEDRILAVTATGGAWTVPYGGYDWILEDVAERTGGRFSTSQSSGDFAQSLRDALDELRSRYVVTFRPSGVDRPGWHELKVTVPTRPKAEVRARKGYFGG